MPTLEELKQRRFIAIGQTVALPPTTRHAGSTVSPMTDGNVVTLLRDGEAYMCRWFAEVEKLAAAGRGEIYHSGFDMNDVKTCGRGQPKTGALAALVRAARAGVKVYVALTGQGVSANGRIVTSLRSQGVTLASLDYRFPIFGTNHSKYTCFLASDGAVLALVGSVDIFTGRWDREQHLVGDPERPEKATHDVGVALDGPAAADVARSFRDRWNDPSRSIGLGVGDGRPPPVIATVPAYKPGGGTSSVQVLHTYGRTYEGGGYSWAKDGEFTVWAAYLKAIRLARTYVYIEDQFFFPMWKPYPSLPQLDIVNELGDAIRLRGVHVAVLVPERSEESGSVAATELRQRHIGITRLRAIAARAGNLRLFRPVTPARRSELRSAGAKKARGAIFVHSKVMLVDDEVAFIGSANFNQRSMTCDGELQVAVVDAGDGVREMRRQLWREHLDDPSAAVDDAAATIEQRFPAPGGRPEGRLHPYVDDLADTANLDRPPERAPFVEPYAGPDLG